MQRPDKIMVIAAHPDDIEMSCGATIAKLTAQRAQVFFLLITSGENGGRRNNLSSAELISLREQEQRKAAEVLGVEEVQFLHKPDGSVVYSSELRGEIVYWIRKWKPNAVFTHDPRTLILDWGNNHSEINHVDHRAVGQVTMDAIYPFARSRLLYPEHFAAVLGPHIVDDLLLWDSDTPNYYEDIGIYINKRLQAVACHQSQFPKMAGVEQWTRQYTACTAQGKEMKHAECFHHLDLRPPF